MSDDLWIITRPPSTMVTTLRLNERPSSVLLLMDSGSRVDADRPSLSLRNRAMERDEDRESTDPRPLVVEARPCPANPSRAFIAREFGPEFVEPIMRMLENVGPDTKRRRENAARPRPIDPEFLTVDELAEVLRSSEITIRRLIRNDAIPRAFVGGKWLFPRALIRDVWVQDPVLAMRLWRDEPARHVAGRGGRAEVPTPRAKTPSSGDAVAVEFPATAAVLARMNARSGR